MKHGLFRKAMFLFLLVACMTCSERGTFAAAAESTDYDGYTFTQFVTVDGTIRGASFQKFYSSYYINLVGVNGTQFTLEKAGNDQYYLRAKCGYDTVYLGVSGKMDDGSYYLGGTASKNSALLWELSNGRIRTTYNSQKFVLWTHWSQSSYSGSDGFRIVEDTSTDSGVVYYPAMTFTPPETPHTHPVCGAECTHEDPHETMEALIWDGSSSTASMVSGYGTLNAGDYYLDSDISVSKKIGISGDVRICLNGHKLNFVGYGFNVSGQGSLELCDCQGTGSINSSPKYESGSYVYEAMTISIGESASVIFHDISYCPDSGTILDNSGTLTVYGGSFTRGIDNSGRVELYDCTVQEDSSYERPLYNTSSGTAIIDGATLISGNYDGVLNYGELSIGGNSVIRANNGNGVYNRGKLKVTDANITGKIAVWNTAWNPSSGPVGGVCEVSGGTFSGGIQNDGMVVTTTSDGVETTQIVKATLKITGTPSIDKIVLKYPDAFEFDYAGTTPIDLEIQVGENFAEGDVVFSINHEKVSAIHLLNTGYFLKTDEGSRIVLAQGTLCDELGHDWGDWGITQAPTYIESGVESRTCTRCTETEERPIAATGQAVVDEIQKEQTAGTVTLEGVPADLLVFGAAYLDGQLVFVQILEPTAGSGTICVPEDVAWDTVKVFFATGQWIPVARVEQYSASNR